MERDTKITAILFLTYVVYGLFYLFEGKYGLLLPYPVIVFLVPGLCIGFFVRNFGKLVSAFFLLFPLILFPPLLEVLFGAAYFWLYLLGSISVPIFLYASIRERFVWGKFFWLPMCAFILLSSAIMIYWYIPGFLMIPMSGLLVVSLITLLLNGKKFELSVGVKQQFLVLALTSALLSTTFVAKMYV
jgi:hypothetical protein